MAARRLSRHLLAYVSAAVLFACADRGSTYYPFETGLWWDYRTRTTILDETREQRFLVANLAAASGDSVIQRQSSGRELVLVRSATGIERTRVRAPGATNDPADAPVLILPTELTLDANWRVASKLALVESRTFAREDKLRHRTLPLELTMRVGALSDTVTVPAGRFTDCLRIDGSGKRNVRTDRGNASAEITVSLSEWYAPGVGLVKSLREETADSPFLKSGRFVQELVAFER